MEPAKLTKLVRGELDWIVMKALEKDRSRRYETANGFAMDIQRYLADEPVQACPPSAWYRFRKMARRNRAAMTMAAMFTVALLIAVAALSVSTVVMSRGFAAEKKAHLQSEASLELGRKAIDEFFTKVSQSKLLDVPGLQPLRMDLLESAVKFQLSLAAERPDDPTVRADLAAAHLRLAILYHEVDRNDDATNSFTSGLDVLEQLRAENPNDRTLYRRVAGFWKAYRPTTSITQLPKDINAVKRNITRLTRLWEQFVAEDPEVLAFRSDLSAIVGLGAALRAATGEPASAVVDFRRQIALCEELVQIRPEEPEYQGTLAQAYTNLAYALGRAGQGAQVREANEKALEIRERLVAKHGDVPQYRRDYLRSLGWKAIRLREQGMKKEFELLTQRLAGELEKLADEYPNVGSYRVDLAAALKDLAAIAIKAGRNADAEKLLSRAYDIRVKLLVDDPQLANTYGLGELASETAGLQRTLGRIEDADRTMRRVYELEDQLAAKYAGERSRNGYRWVFAHMSRFYAGYLWGTGRPKETIVPLKKAVEAFEKLVAEEPSRRDAWNFLVDTQRQVADSYDAIHAPGEAEEALRRLVELHEQRAAKLSGGPDAAVWSARGAYHARLKQWDKATADYSKAIELDPKQAHSSNQLGHMLWQFGSALSAAGRHDEAKKAYRQAAAVFEKLASDFPKEAFHQQELGFTYYVFLGPLLEKTKQPQEAEQAYRKAVAVHEKLVIETGNAKYRTRLNACYDLLASVLKANGKTQDAEKVRRQAIEFYEKRATANPEMTEYRREIGQLYLQFREWDKAAAAYTKVIERKPDDWDAWHKRGWTYANLQQWRKAIDDYSEAIKLQPKRWESWTERGHVHLTLREWEKSIADYTKAIELAPGVHANWLHRGLAYMELGQWDKVADDFSNLLKRFPDDYNVWHDRAVAYTKLNQPEKAVADLRQAFAKGYKDLEGVKKDERFAPLRNREDFKKLLTELEAKKK
jgi:tetratricopeptide (TPR) repeat protein